MMTAGGRQMATPNFSDAVPPKPDKQGGMASPNYTTPTTFATYMPPTDAGTPSNWKGLIDDDGLSGHDMDFTAMAGGTGVANKGMGEGIRGFRSTPVGGTYNPGQGKSPGSPGVERSNAS